MPSRANIFRSKIFAFLALKSPVYLKEGAAFDHSDLDKRESEQVASVDGTHSTKPASSPRKSEHKKNAVVPIVVREERVRTEAVTSCATSVGDQDVTGDLESEQERRHRWNTSPVRRRSSANDVLKLLADTTPTTHTSDERLAMHRVYSMPNDAEAFFEEAGKRPSLIVHETWESVRKLRSRSTRPSETVWNTTSTGDGPTITELAKGSDAGGTSYFTTTGTSLEDTASVRLTQMLTEVAQTIKEKQEQQQMMLQQSNYYPGVEKEGGMLLFHEEGHDDLEDTGQFGESDDGLNDTGPRKFISMSDVPSHGYNDYEGERGERNTSLPGPAHHPNILAAGRIPERILVPFQFEKSSNSSPRHSGKHTKNKRHSKGSSNRRRLLVAPVACSDQSNGENNPITGPLAP